MLRFVSAFTFLLVTTFSLAACNGESKNTNAESVASSSTGPLTLDVYKSPTCGCCQIWIEHTDANGFRSNVHNTEDLNAVKARFGIASKYQSCHTGVSADGYIFEGHVPARLIKQFLAEKPVNAIGLAVPGMPIGSPGMEVGDRIAPYDVLLLKKDGTSSVYAHVTALEK